MADIIAFDLDGIIAVEAHAPDKVRADSYATRTINHHVKALMETAFENGWTVYIYTGRREEERKLTENWLYAHGVKYHLLLMDKPYYTFIVDDRSRTVDEMWTIVEDRGRATGANHAKEETDCSGAEGNSESGETCK
jgi:hypothetical protein